MFRILLFREGDTQVGPEAASLGHTAYVTQLLLCEGKAESSRLRLLKFSSTGEAISTHKLAASLDQE